MEGSSYALSASAYMNASNTNVSNFVSLKLSGDRNYLLWKTQMLCLLESINVCGIVDEAFVAPSYSDPETMRQYNNLIRGWIFGSVTGDVLVHVYKLSSAKAVWEKLQSIYDPPVCLPENSTSEKPDAKAKIEEINVVPHTNSTVVTISTETETNNEATQIIEHKKKLKRLKSAIVEGDLAEVKSMIFNNKGLATKIISNDGSTALHIAVGIGYNDIMRFLLRCIDNEQIRQQRVSDGSTALHIAAVVGNKEAAELLVKRNKELLRVQDKDGRIPSSKANQHMHLDILAYLLESNSHDPYGEIALLKVAVNAISARKYSIALQFLQYNPEAALTSDEVLMAIAKNFPSGLDGGEKLIYPPSLKSIWEFLWEILWKIALVTVFLFSYPAIGVAAFCSLLYESHDKLAINILTTLLFLVGFVILTGPVMLASALAIILLLVSIVSLPFLLLYHLLWKGAKILAFPPIMKIENKIEDWNEAKKLLAWVCDEIDKLNYTDAHHPHFVGPIIEATRQNAYDVVDEILSRSPEATQDKNGYNIILLAILNRSEKIYNRIYDVGEGKNLYRMYEDSKENNILHLAGKLASSNVLKQRIGAALQLQRELQWREEVKKLVIPTFITKKNIDNETPEEIFTREHKDLMKDGEQWMKTTAESCSITAALITTIVFAAAITVPGGSNQEKGTPLFKKEIAFIIFAISDAISLFASTTALLVFLSILTARFAENDFLVSLPRRLFIGLFSLLLSTTTMMVAFSATVFLVFCDKKLWMLAPICGLAFIPIAVFVSLQFPLLVDLFSSAYLPIFGRESKNTPKDFIRKIHGYTFKVFAK